MWHGESGSEMRHSQSVRDDHTRGRKGSCSHRYRSSVLASTYTKMPSSKPCVFARAHERRAAKIFKSFSYLH